MRKFVYAIASISIITGCGAAYSAEDTAGNSVDLFSAVNLDEEETYVTTSPVFALPDAPFDFVKVKGVENDLTEYNAIVSSFRKIEIGTTMCLKYVEYRMRSSNFARNSYLFAEEC